MEKKTYRVLGLVLRTDFPFVARLPETSAVPDVDVSWQPGAMQPEEHGRPVYESPLTDEQGRCALRVFAAQEPGVRVFRVPAGARFTLSAGAPAGVVCEAPEEIDLNLVEAPLLGAVLGAVLELRGRPVMHASAVEWGDGAVAFLAGNRAGKTALAAGSMALGASLVADDTLALDLSGEDVQSFPSYPQLRCWPDDARRLLGTAEGLAPAHPTVPKLRVPVGPGGFGRFTAAHSLPLRCLYVPERGGAGEPVAITPLSGVESILNLLRHSLLARLTSALGMDEARLRLLARFVNRVPVRRLRYPGGWGNLPRTLEAVREDLRRMTSEPRE